MYNPHIACPIGRVDLPKKYYYEYEVCDGTGTTFVRFSSVEIPSQFFGCSIQSPAYCVPVFSALSPSDSEDGRSFVMIHKEEVVADDGNCYELMVLRTDSESGSFIVPVAKEIEPELIGKKRKVKIQTNPEGLLCIEDTFCRFLIAEKI